MIVVNNAILMYFYNNIFNIYKFYKLWLLKNLFDP